MEIDTDEIDVIGSTKAKKWFSSMAVSGKGKAVSLNIRADSQGEADVLAQAAGIANNLHCHKRAEPIALWSDYEQIKE